MRSTRPRDSFYSSAGAIVTIKKYMFVSGTDAERVLQRELSVLPHPGSPGRERQQNWRAACEELATMVGA